MFMNSIINFYQGLDTLNLILFWGIIIVITLLLIFSIILVNKNRKLKDMLISNNRNRENSSFGEEIEDIPVIVTPKEDINIKEDISPKINIPVEEVTMPNIETTEEPIIENNQSEEKNFVAEEHVMEYKQELFNLPNIEKTESKKETITEESQEIIKEEPKKEETRFPNAPYQRNVLKEKYFNQTVNEEKKDQDGKNIKQLIGMDTSGNVHIFDYTFKKDISNFENEENNNNINININNNNIPNLQNLIEQNENYKAKIADIKDSLL